MHLIAPGVWLLRGLPFHALNIYLVEDVLIDGGIRWQGRSIRSQLRGRPVTKMALTHCHPDHQGASHAICEQLGINSNLVGAAVARTAESMWNPLYGTRGGVPYGGACLPKDTVAFLQFARDLGMEHQLLEATISVNRRLGASMPAAPSADKVDEVREAARQQDAATIENLTLELGGSPAIVL